MKTFIASLKEKVKFLSKMVSEVINFKDGVALDTWYTVVYHPYFGVALYLLYFYSQTTLALVAPEDVQRAFDRGEYYLGYEWESYDESQSFEPTLSDVPKKHYSVDLRFHREEISSETFTEVAKSPKPVAESSEPVEESSELPDIDEYYATQVISYQDHIDSYKDYVPGYTKLGLIKSSIVYVERSYPPDLWATSEEQMRIQESDFNVLSYELINLAVNHCEDRSFVESTVNLLSSLTCNNLIHIYQAQGKLISEQGLVVLFDTTYNKFYETILQITPLHFRE